MLIQSTRFGEIEVSNQDLLSFPDGLPGFLDEKKFAFLPQGQDNPFALLQSAISPDLAFVIVEPFTFFSDYSFQLSDDFVQELKLSKENPPQIFNIVTIKENLENATINLLAPIIVNWQTKTAQQIILEKTEYITRHKLFPNGLPQKAASEGGK